LSILIEALIINNISTRTKMDIGARENSKEEK